MLIHVSKYALTADYRGAIIARFWVNATIRHLNEKLRETLCMVLVRASIYHRLTRRYCMNVTTMETKTTTCIGHKIRYAGAITSAGDVINFVVIVSRYFAFPPLFSNP